MKSGILSFVVILASLYAAGEPSDFEAMMNQQSSLRTQEEIVRVGKDEYRRILVKNREFFLRLPQKGDVPENIQVICENPASRSFFKSESMIVLQTQVGQRTQVFISGLESACTEVGKAILIPSLKLGFKFADSEDGFLKNRAVYMNLLGRELGFRGDF